MYKMLHALARFIKGFGSPSLLLVIPLLLISIFSFSVEFPARSNTLVTDYTGILNDGQRNSLERKLVAFNDSTSTQIAVVIINTTGGLEIADYSVQLFNNWKIGQEKKNNGVLILVAKDDRKMWITTGYGIEGVLPDVVCKRVIENDLVPNFKQNNFYEGIDQATNTMMSIVIGEFAAEDYMNRGKKVPWFPFVMFIVVLLIVIFSKMFRTRKYAHTNNLGFWAAWALLNAATSRSRGSWGGFSGGSGGFGGFGGGGSGGGGAGGSW